MCGIAGGFSFSSSADPIDQAVVLRLNDLQRRRGPDGVGLWSSDDKRIVLGHRRLAIIDTGAGGAQPMADATGRWVISFNGEIYNYRALRVELERMGCVFRTQCDTEVLINAVAQWGEGGAVPKLRGMFAFALWDGLQQELWLARDPYGIKPLYVAESQGTLWFASQARPLARLVRRSTPGAMRRRSPGSIFGAMCRSHFRGGPASACFRLAMCSASALEKRRCAKGFCLHSRRVCEPRGAAAGARRVAPTDVGDGARSPRVGRAGRHLSFGRASTPM